MAINSYGYPETIAPGSTFAQFSGHGFGHRYSTIGFSDWRVTAATSGTRLVNIAAGWAMGKGIMVQNTESMTYGLPAPAGTSQWMLVGLRRWSGTGPAYTSIVTHTLGTATRAVPTVTQTPGTNDTQWLALCRVTSTDALVQDVVDLRLVATEGASFYTCYSDLAMDQLSDVVGAEVYRADTTSGHVPSFYKLYATVSGALTWKNLSNPEKILTGTAFTSGAAFPGWSQSADQRLVSDRGWVWAHIELTKSGGQITATAAGSLGDNEDLLTLNPEWRPGAPVSGSAYVTSDASVERNAGVRLRTDGIIHVTSAEPNAVVRKVTADLFYSIA